MTISSDNDDRTISYATPAAAPPRTAFLARSWLIFSVAFVLCSLAPLFIVVDRSRLAQTFSYFNLKIPALAQAVMDVPTPLILGLGLVTILLLLAVQIRMKSKPMAAVIHLIAIAGWSLIVLVYREIMWKVITQIVSSLSRSWLSPSWP